MTKNMFGNLRPLEQIELVLLLVMMIGAYVVAGNAVFDAVTAPHATAPVVSSHAGS